MLETLHWNVSGAVWAIDHSEPPRPIDGLYTQILAVRDLASGLQLAWTPVADATVLGSVAVLFVLVGVAVCYVPARRAARVSPSLSLRSE